MHTNVVQHGLRSLVSFCQFHLEQVLCNYLNNSEKLGAEVWA